MRRWVPFGTKCLKKVENSVSWHYILSAGYAAISGIKREDEMGQSVEVSIEIND